MPKLSSSLFYSKPSRSLSSSSSSSCCNNLQTLLKRGFTPTLDSILQFLLFLSHSRKFNTVLNLFSQMESNQIENHSQAPSILTGDLLKLQRYEEAEHFMRTQIAKGSNFPGNRMWDTLIQARESGQLCPLWLQQNAIELEGLS